MKSFSVGSFVLICLPICLASAGSAEESGKSAALRFKQVGGEFEFNTGVLSGKLRSDRKSVGLLPVIHIPSGAVLTRSMGLVGHYRVFSSNHRYGTGAWHWTSSAKLLEDGSVEVHWPSADDREFELWAVYRWAGPATLDVDTSVRAHKPLSGFETFLASYLAEQFTASLVYVRRDAGASSGPEFIAAEQSFGAWQIFPRDPPALSLIKDGRWKIAPHPVDWTVRPMLAAPLAVRRDTASGIAVILMAAPEDCFAVATPHQTESHYAIYLSLFGRSLKAGEMSRSRARLAIAASPSDAEIVTMYQTYLAQLRSSAGKR